jgi:hypothetical protein
VAAADVLLGGVNNASVATTIRSDEAVSTAKAIVGIVLYDGGGGSTAGVQGQSNAVNGNGVFGVAMAGNSKGVWGRSAAGTGVYGEATDATGVSYGVRGTTPSTGGIGIQGVSTATSGTTFGVHGQVASTSGRGVQGVSTATNGTGVYGIATTGTGAFGVRGRTANGRAVYGEATGTTGTNLRYGVYGSAASSYGIGVRGDGPRAGTWGVGGIYGVYGDTSATANGTYGVYGISRSTGNSGAGVFGRASRGVGVRGFTDGTGSYGVLGSTSGSGSIGVYGAAPSGDGYAVYGFGGAWAGYFAGDVRITGDLNPTSASVVIDHPADPANRTLEHSFVEAPERLNVYRGNVTLDASGRATVQLPRYVRAFNAEYSYQLTAIGGQAPGLYISREITAASFGISGGLPGQKVCWMVTGTRHDAWARRHPLRVERTKKPKDRGRYLNPEAFGKPRSASIHPRPVRPRMPRPGLSRPEAMAATA